MKETVGTCIAQHRKRLGITQDRLAAAIGVSKQTIWAIENGRQWPEYGNLRAIASTLKVDERALFADPSLVVEPTDQELLALLQKRLSARKPPDSLTPEQKELIAILPALNEDELDTLMKFIRSFAGAHEDAPGRSADVSQKPQKRR